MRDMVLPSSAVYRIVVLILSTCIACSLPSNGKINFAQSKLTFVITMVSASETLKCCSYSVSPCHVLNVMLCFIVLT